MAQLPRALLLYNHLGFGQTPYSITWKVAGRIHGGEAHASFVQALAPCVERELIMGHIERGGRHIYIVPLSRLCENRQGWERFPEDLRSPTKYS